MKVTTDTHTGKPFRWNTTVEYFGFVVPARSTPLVDTCLHPARVPVKLLRKLNDGREWAT